MNLKIKNTLWAIIITIIFFISIFRITSGNFLDGIIGFIVVYFLTNVLKVIRKDNSIPKC